MFHVSKRVRSLAAHVAILIGGAGGSKTVAVLMVLLTLIACGRPGDPEGPSAQDTSAKMIALDGMDEQGALLAGCSWVSLTVKLSSLTGSDSVGFSSVILNQGQLVAKRASTTYLGTDAEPLFRGAQLDGTVTNAYMSGPVRVTILAVYPHTVAGAPVAGQYEYQIQVPSLGFPGVYDTARVLLASGYWGDSGTHVASSATATPTCSDGVIYKCMDWGYRPWASSGTQSMEPYYQACIRMARADYLGNGVAHTKNGNTIFFCDNLQSCPAPPAGFLLEAAWTADGAYCFSRMRLPPPVCPPNPGSFDDSEIIAGIPDCARLCAPGTPGCSSPLPVPAVLIQEYSPILPTPVRKGRICLG